MMLHTQTCVSRVKRGQTHPANVSMHVEYMYNCTGKQEAVPAQMQPQALEGLAAQRGGLPLCTDLACVARAGEPVGTLDACARHRQRNVSRLCACIRHR